MKAFFSILLLSMLIFNWVGYRLVLGIMENKADQVLDRKIENSDYDESSLIEIKVPLNSPYLADYFSEFDRYVGELDLDGVHYKYVKRKIINGELVLFCLPNVERNDLQNSREEFFKLVNDLNHSQKPGKGETSSFKSLTIDYQVEENNWVIGNGFRPHLTYAVFDPLSVALGHGKVPERPPKA